MPLDPASVLRRARAAGLPGLVLLESAGPLTPQSRYSFFSAAPERHVDVCPDRPSASGLFPAWLGGITYEHDERYGYYPSGLVWDRERGTMDVVGTPHLDWSTLLAGPECSPTLQVGTWSPDDVDYVDGVRQIQELIRAGEVYQVNLSRGVRAEADGDPLAAYLRLRELNPSPFMAFVDFGYAGGDVVVSCSPERLVLWTPDEVSARPIAGTRRRGDDAAEDANFGVELRESDKERAEHTMLVDLVRHDVGRVAAPGTVEVPEFHVIERYSHVMHLVSKVSATPRDDVTPADLLTATFPGGTITGAPKDRVCEVIADLEPHPRGWYTGSVGIVSGPRVDFNILIRTAAFTPDGDRWTVQVRAGGGTVIDSDPDAEARETVHKAQALLASLTGHPGRPAQEGAAPEAADHWRPTAIARISHTRRVAVVDNRDSFTFNLVHDLWALGADVDVFPGTSQLEDIIQTSPHAVLVGPGPGSPDAAGVSRELIEECRRRRLPLLGVCLGHQVLGQVLGGRVVRANPIHGKPYAVTHDGGGLFDGIPQGADFGRYHSLTVDHIDERWVTARASDGTIMALGDPYARAWGVQFHPESVLSPHGRRLLRNWLEDRA